MNEVRRFWDHIARRDPNFGTCGAGKYARDFYGETSTGPLFFMDNCSLDGKLALDIGCGWGRVLLTLADKAIAFGLDISTEMIKLARQRINARGLSANLVVGDATCLPFKPGSFDLIYSYSVMQHLPKNSLRTTLRELAYSLRKGGEVRVALPNRFGPDGIAATIAFGLLKRRSFWGPAAVRYYHLREARSLFAQWFFQVRVLKHEFRIPWILFHEKILAPGFVLRILRKISQPMEIIANQKFSLLGGFCAFIEVIAKDARATDPLWQ